jgi:hypothetical protein
MTDKMFYQTAAAEAAAGVIDKALWIKIGAENPTATDHVLRALYIQARAAELSREGMTKTVAAATAKARNIGRKAATAAVVLAFVGFAGYLFTINYQMESTTKAIYADKQGPYCQHLYYLAGLPLSSVAFDSDRLKLAMVACQMARLDSSTP